MPCLNLLVIRARDPDALARFYSALGFAFVRHRHGSGPEHYACEESGSVFEIYPANASGPTQSLRLGFAVIDLRAIVAQAEAAGGIVTTPPAESPWGMRAVMTDLEGHRLELTQA